MSRVVELFNNNLIIAALAYIIGSLIVATILWVFISKVLMRIALRTRTTVDDDIILSLRRPLFLTVLLIGIGMALSIFELYDHSAFVINGLILTLIVLLWASAGVKVFKIILGAISRNMDNNKFIQPRTLPLFEVSMKTVFVGGAIYAFMIIWHIDVTAWLASAGIVGIAVGFAAKDTLSNFFAGIFIIADAPYKLGDYIVLDTGERGKVTDIGIRSTRILTRDDIQIIIPNATIGNAKIMNETAGPSQKRRVKVDVGVAYGTDVDVVRSILLTVAQECEFIVTDPEPRVRFWQFGESSLDFQLLGWIDEPSMLGQVKDLLNTNIYKRFAKEKVEIPFPQRDLHMIEK